MSFEAHEHRFIIGEVDGEQEVHAAWAGSGDYATMCGFDIDDTSLGHRLIGTAAKAKINCQACAGLIRIARHYKLSDLADGTLKENGT